MAKKRDNGTGTIYRRDNGTWVGKIYIGRDHTGKEKFKYLSGKTESDVKRKIREYNKSATPTDTSRVSVENYIYNWLNTYKKNTIKDTSYDTLEKTVRNYIVPGLGSFHFSQLTSDDIQKFLQKLKEEGYSYSIVKKAYNCLNEVFKHASVRQDISMNPMLAVKMLSEETFDKKEIRFFNERECMAIIEEARRTYSSGRPVYVYGDVFVLILNTGLRLGEVLGLEKEDWNKEDKTLRVKRNLQFVSKRDDSGNAIQGRVRIMNSTKTYSGDRTIPLNESATAALERLCSQFPDKKQIVSTSKGTEASHQNIERTFTYLLDNIGIDRAGPHSLRHTFASILFSRGVDVKTVSELLGHANVQITMNTYIHLLGNTKHSAVGKLDEIF